MWKSSCLEHQLLLWRGKPGKGGRVWREGRVNTRGHESSTILLGHVRSYLRCHVKPTTILLLKIATWALTLQLTFSQWHHFVEMIYRPTTDLVYTWTRTFLEHWKTQDIINLRLQESTQAVRTSHQRLLPFNRHNHCLARHVRKLLRSYVTVRGQSAIATCVAIYYCSHQQ